MPNPSLRSFTARTILVTGATGFLGRHTVRALLLAGHRVIAVGRDADAAQGIHDWAVDEGFPSEAFPGRLGGLALPTAMTEEGRTAGSLASSVLRDGPEPVRPRRTVLGWARMDLTDMGSIGVLTRALRGVDAIVHSAALSDWWAPAQDFQRANLDVTRHLAMLAQLARIPRFVHVSTPSVGFAPEAQVDQDEYDAWPQEPINGYAASKRAAERALDEMLPAATAGPDDPAAAPDAQGSSARGNGREAFVVKTVVVRPRGMVGPGDPSIVPRLLRLAQRGRVPLLRRGRARIDLSAVENVAQALTHLATTDDPRPFEQPSDVPAHRRVVHPVFHLTNGEPMRIADLLDALCLNHGLSPRRLPVPYRLLAKVGGACERLADRLFKATLGLWRWMPPMTRYGAALLAFDHTLSIARAQAWGYAPTVRLGESLHHHAGWYRAAQGQTPAEAVRLSLVHAARLPDVRENGQAERPRAGRPVPVGASWRRSTALLSGEGDLPDHGLSARYPSVDDLGLPASSTFHHDPIDEDLYQRVYAADGAYGSGALRERLVWNAGAHPTGEVANTGAGQGDDPAPSDPLADAAAR